MRWGYIIPRALLLGALWAFFAFGFDPVLRIVAVSGAEQAVGAKVDIESVRTGFSPLSVSVRGVRVANKNAPGTNLIEFESLALGVSGAELAHKSLIVEEGELRGLKWGTPRSDSGLLPESPNQKTGADEEAAKSSQSKLVADTEAQAAALFSGIAGNLEKGLDPRQFETVRLGDELEKRWNGNFTQLETQARDLKSEIDDIERIVKSHDGNKLERLDAYRRAIGESQDALKRIQQLKTEVDSEKQQSRSDFANFNQARERDLTKIRDEANLFQSDPQQLVEFLLGPELEQRGKEAVQWIRWARDHYHGTAQRPPTVRQRGEFIEFQHQMARPRLLVKLLKISGNAEFNAQSFDFTGMLTGLTSNPELLGEPIVLQLNSEGGVEFDLKAVADYTRPDAEPQHSVVCSYSTEQVSPLRMGDEKSLLIDVAAKKLVCHAEIKLVGEHLSGQIHLEEQQASLTPTLGGQLAKLPPPAMDSIHDTIGAIRGVQATLHLDGTLESPRFQIESDLGQQVAAGIGAAFTHQLDAGREKLAAQLNDQADKQTNRLKDLFRQKSKGLSDQLAVNETQVNQLMKQLTGGRLAELDQPLSKGLDALKGGKGSPAADVKPAVDEVQDDLKKLFRR
jgi:uncharacterized protein (TIGR03545 family)